jgi:CRP-like cAMP-binding protein
VGVLALLDEEPRMADAVTAEPSLLVMIDKADFLEVVERYPNVALSLLRCMARRIRQAARQQVQHQELDVTGRLSRLLLELAVRSPEQGVIESLPRQHHLAARIGCTRESVSRALSGLVAAGAIEKRGKGIVIVNARALRRLGRA